MKSQALGCPPLTSSLRPGSLTLCLSSYPLHLSRNVAQAEEGRGGSRGQRPALPLACYVALGKHLYSCKPQFPHVENGEKTSPYL